MPSPQEAMSKAIERAINCSLAQVNSIANLVLVLVSSSYHMHISLPNLTPHEFLSSLLQLISALQSSKDKKLNANEIELLVTFLLLPTKFSSYPFSTAGKKKVAAKLSLSPQLLHQRIYSLLKKGYLLKDEDEVILLPKFLTSLLKKFVSSSSLPLTITFTLDPSFDTASLKGDFPPD